MSKTVRTKVTGTFCPNCGGRDLVMNRNEEFVCTKCGHVIAHKNLTKEPEWRAFSPEDKKKIRAGSPPTPLLKDKGMSTVIGHDKGKAKGNFAKDIGRMRTWNRRIRSEGSKQRNLKKTLALMNRIGDALDLPSSVLEEGSHIYRIALDHNMVRGRTITGIATAALYAAMRYENLPWTPDDIAEASGEDTREITKNYRLLVRHLGLKMPVVDPVSYVSRIVGELGLPKKVGLAARRIVRRAQDERLTSGKSSAASAAGAIYLVSMKMNIEVEASQIAEASGVTQTTIKNHYDLLTKNLGNEIDEIVEGRKMRLKVKED